MGGYFFPEKSASEYKLEKEVTPAICVCVFAVATVLLRHSWTTANTKFKYWPSELSTEANEKNDHAMFVVDEKALAQGIFLFKGCLKSRFGLEIEEKRGGSQFSTAPFRGLEGRSRVYLVSFPSSISGAELFSGMTPREKKKIIKEHVDVLLSHCGYEDVGVVCPELIAGMAVTVGECGAADEDASTSRESAHNCYCCC